MPLPFFVAPGLPRPFPSPDLFPLPCPFPSPDPSPGVPAPGALTGAWTHRARAAPALPWPWRHWGLQPRPSGPPRSRGTATAARGTTTGTRQGCSGEGLITAQGPRRDLSALWSPSPPWSSSCGGPGLPPAPAPSEGPCRHRTGTAQDQDIALPRSLSVPPPHSHLKVVPATRQRVPAGGTWLPPLSVVMSPCCPLPERSHCIQRDPPALPGAPMPAQVSPQLLRGA